MSSPLDNLPASNNIKRLPKVAKTTEKMDGTNNQEEKEDNELHIKILKDGASGKRYSYNKRTGETSWMDPEVKEERRGEGTDDGEEKEGDTKIKVGDGGKQEEKLVIAIDAATGRQYSYDPATGTSLWID